MREDTVTASVIVPSTQAYSQMLGCIIDGAEMSASGMRHGECPCYCSRCECWCECSDCRSGQSAGRHTLEALALLWNNEHQWP
jgi:hypothetical protein